jgi:hypothetical protein
LNVAKALAGVEKKIRRGGFGDIQLSPEQCRDEGRLYAEAVTYAMHFAREDDDLVFRIGCCNYTNNRAFVRVIEAARLLCSGDGDMFAARLLRAALKEIIRNTCRDTED